MTCLASIIITHLHASVNSVGISEGGRSSEMIRPGLSNCTSLIAVCDLRGLGVSFHTSLPSESLKSYVQSACSGQLKWGVIGGDININNVRMTMCIKDILA